MGTDLGFCASFPANQPKLVALEASWRIAAAALLCFLPSPYMSTAWQNARGLLALHPSTNPKDVCVHETVWCELLIIGSHRHRKKAANAASQTDITDQAVGRLLPCFDVRVANDV